MTDHLYDLSDPDDSASSRKQVLAVSQRTMPEDVLAVVRLSWYKDGAPCEVDEFQIIDITDEGYEALTCVVSSAIQNGADVAVISDLSPEDMGLE